MRRLATIAIILWMINPLPALAETKIYCLGDSLTLGFGVDEAESWPSLVQSKFDQARPQQVLLINGGINGSSSASGPPRLRFALNTQPDWVILALGANDGLRGQDLKAMKKNLAQTIELAQEAKVKVLLVGMLLPPNYGKAYTDEFAQSYRDLAKRYQIPMVPFLLEGVAGKTKLNQADGIHPNRDGYRIIAKNIFTHLNRLIQ